MVTNASDPPDGELAKEVYAHFGLCMYLAQVLETGLINVLTAMETALAVRPDRSTFDRLYAKHESYTFGNLTRALSAHNFIDDDLMSQVKDMKDQRDILAHRFFRDHDLDFLTVGGCHVMIEKLSAMHSRFAEIDSQLSTFTVQAFEKIGMDPSRFHEDVQKLEAEMFAEAKTRYASAFPRKSD